MTRDIQRAGGLASRNFPYLLRNPQLVQEIGSHMPCQEALLRGSNAARHGIETKFYSLGSYQSRSIGREVFVGLKIVESPGCTIE